MGLREQLRSLRRQAHEDMDFLVLKDGGRYYYSKQDAAELWLDTFSRTYAYSEAELPELRKVLPQATEESVSSFEERHQFPVTQQVAIVGFPDEGQVVVRHIALDGGVRTFLLEGEAAKEHRNAAGREARAKPLDPNREGVREVDPKQESELLEIPDLSE